MDRQAAEPTTLYAGIPCQRVVVAIRSAVPAIGEARAAQAAEAALKEGYITEADRDGLMEELL